MKKIKLALALIFPLMISCYAQNAVTIKNVYPFITITIAGRSMSDDNGNNVGPAPVITRFLYIESKGAQKPMIDSIFYNGIAFIPTLTKVEKRSENIGVKAANGTPFMVTAAKGNELWRIDLHEVGEKPLPQTDKAITIQLLINKKKFSFTKKEIEIKGPDMY